MCYSTPCCNHIYLGKHFCELFLLYVTFLMARNSYLFNLLLSIHFLLTEHASSRGLGLDTRDLKLHASQDPFNICRHLHCHALHWGEVIHAGWHEDACSYKKKDLHSRFFVIYFIYSNYYISVFVQKNILINMLVS